jgi:hypothetical protein
MEDDTPQPQLRRLLDRDNNSSATFLNDTTTTQQQEEEDDVYLFSLQWTPDDSISKPVRDLWKWKDANLGDGRDFFVPKPKTIAALQDYIVRKSAASASASNNTNDNHLHLLQECSVISNCARLEILCVAPTNINTNPRLHIAHCLVAQMQAVPPKPQIFQSMMMMDWPDMVLDPNAPLGVEGDNDAARNIANHMTQIKGLEAVLLHLSLVAAGMADRPRRPDRETIFRPFSSRDAHVLLQLKRTKDALAISYGKQQQTKRQRRRLDQLLEYALRAGKAARNPQKVPLLEVLRDYGTGDSKYSTQAPKELLNQVAKVSELYICIYVVVVAVVVVATLSCDASSAAANE